MTIRVGTMRIEEAGGSNRAGSSNTATIVDGESPSVNRRSREETGPVTDSCLRIEQRAVTIQATPTEI